MMAVQAGREAMESHGRLNALVGDYRALPGVRDELAGILSDTAGGSAPLRGGFLLDAQFTRASLEEGLARARPVLHIASHFIMKPGQEGDSFLLLGDGTRLTLEEISRSSRLRFQGVELLTISACETALGGEGTGLEVEGFGALAQNKGAGAVIASLWSISDDATAAFMRTFYAKVARDGLSKAEAMRATQREMMASARFSDPWFWAPFILMGNWK
jgi:CHAT domain-containing protein